MIRILCIGLLLASTAVAAPFSFKIALTRQDVSMDWWYAVPSAFTPEISPIQQVARGEYFRIIPVFENYETDTNHNAYIRFDVEVTGPDGSTLISLPKCEGHFGPAQSPGPLPAQAVLNLCFEPDDPFGEYRIDVTAIDQVSSQTNRQSKVLRLKKFVFQPLDKPEREALFLSYPADPNPGKAAAAFLQTEQSFFNDRNEPIWSAIWFYKTVFSQHEYLIAHLLEEFPFATLKQKRDIILVMTLMGKEDRLPRMSGDLKAFLRVMQAGRFPDPYDELISGNQLDMLWAEFFATGTVKPLRQIINALSLVEYVGTLEQIKAGTLNADEPEVYRAGMMEGIFQSTLWSLREYGRTAPLVYPYCIGILSTEDLAKPTENCLALLLQSIAPAKESQPEEQHEKNN